MRSTNDIVKQLGIKVSNVQLLKLMEDDGLIYRTRNRKEYYVTAPYNKFNFRKATTIINPTTGKPMTINKWTEAGKQWIFGLALGYKII